MNLRKGTPGKGGGSRPDSFSYTGVKAGLANTFGAWLAGEVYWAQAHEHTDAQPGTKPCLDWMTDGALRCKRCRPHVLTTWVGWVPLYREVDHKPILVVVHESALDLLKDLRYPAHVSVGRVDAKSSVFVRKSESGVLFRTDNEARKCPVDITRDLLNMWRLPDLDQWLLDQRRGVMTATRETVPLKSDGEPFSMMTAAAARRVSAPVLGTDGVPEVDEALRAIQRRQDEHRATRNGHHKPKG